MRSSPFSLISAVLLVGVTASPAPAEETADAAPLHEVRERPNPYAPLPFAGGFMTGFIVHESAHFGLDLAFDADPGLRGVDFHGLPFFAVSHRSGLPPRRELLISWAGFGTQHMASEWLLTRHPDLKAQGTPFARGVLAFHVACSAAYGVGAFGKTGPAERDTRGIASSARVDERVVGALVVAPAALDTYRYFHPRARWAAWASRGLKVGLIALVVR
jgi:hypothetical protein